MYNAVRIIFLCFAWLFGGLAVAFMAYVLVANTGEFVGNIANPLWMIYFIPAVVCYWISNWAANRRRR